MPLFSVYLSHVFQLEQTCISQVWLGCALFLSHLIAGKHDGGFVILLVSHKVFELEFVSFSDR